MKRLEPRDETQHSGRPADPVRGWCQLIEARVKSWFQRRVRSIGTWNHHRTIAGVQQRQIIRGIAESKHLHIRTSQVLLQPLQCLAFADIQTQQVPETIALHHRQSPLGSKTQKLVA